MAYQTYLMTTPSQIRRTVPQTHALCRWWDLCRNMDAKPVPAPPPVKGESRVPIPAKGISLNPNPPSPHPIISGDDFWRNFAQHVQGGLLTQKQCCCAPWRSTISGSMHSLHLTTLPIRHTLVPAGASTQTWQHVPKMCAHCWRNFTKPPRRTIGM